MPERIKRKIRLPSVSLTPDDKGHHSSRVARGKSLLPTNDGRGTWARMMSDVFLGLVTHCGGNEVLTDTKRMSCRRIATLECELIMLEDKIASLRVKRRDVPLTLLSTYGMLAERQRRLSDTIGWSREMQQVNDLTLEQHIANRVNGNGAHNFKPPRQRTRSSRPITVDHED